jgi:hypothetical protein
MAAKTSVPRCLSAPGEKPPTRQPAKSQPAQEPKGYGTPASRMRDDAGPSQKVSQPSDLKAAASQRAPAEKHPMRTRSQASRAGGLQSGGGLGQTDTCVAQGNPSNTQVVIFSSAEVSSPS